MEAYNNLDANIGKEFEDTVTAFRGRCTAYAVYETGPARLLIESLDKTDRPIECWYDIDRLVPVA